MIGLWSKPIVLIIKIHTSVWKSFQQAVTLRWKTLWNHNSGYHCFSWMIKIFTKSSFRTWSHLFLSYSYIIRVFIQLKFDSFGNINVAYNDSKVMALLNWPSTTMRKTEILPQKINSTTLNYRSATFAHSNWNCPRKNGENLTKKNHFGRIKFGDPSLISLASPSYPKLPVLIFPIKAPS